ncbi:prepilin-type N-terminal cleavage/methylation domain-containing protein [Cellulomonas sp. URHE0023]|uniref:prepilin-type N-terminal cleavage/methylation domain-containing protein n=1 Tax=Cellulomonas sp. URHE0023 TaxID=1380354 RepID=UPI000AF6C5E3|nr:prepilin-type N-terminal cleavage/methylation domain-containing protein [Cellulomonas sp. URHE0023]
MTRIRAALQRRTSETDNGMTLVELLVSMGILTVIIGMFMGGVVVMTKDTSRAQGVSNAGDAARKVFQRMDKEIRYSSSINRPGVGTTAGTYYVEYLISAVGAGQKPLCTQWRYTSSTRTLDVRTWRVQATPVVSGWNTMAVNVRNNLSVSTQLPFVFTPAGSTYQRQQLRVFLDMGVGSGTTAKAGAQLDSYFFARNTSAASQSNPESVSVPGQSANPVCTGPGRP